MDGLVTQDGESLGAIRAFEAAGRALPIMNGEGRLPYLDYWLKNKPVGLQGLRHRKRPRVHHQPGPWESASGSSRASSRSPATFKPDAADARHHEHHHGRSAEQVHHGRQREASCTTTTWRRRASWSTSTTGGPRTRSTPCSSRAFFANERRHASACRLLATRDG